MARLVGPPSSQHVSNSTLGLEYHFDLHQSDGCIS